MTWELDPLPWYKRKDSRLRRFLLDYLAPILAAALLAVVLSVEFVRWWVSGVVP